MSLVRVKQKYQITIPQKLRSEVRLEVGDLIDMFIRKNDIVLKPKTIVDRNVGEALEEGLNDLHAGRVTPSFSSVKEFKRFLKK